MESQYSSYRNIINYGVSILVITIGICTVLISDFKFGSIDIIDYKSIMPLNTAICFVGLGVANIFIYKNVRLIPIVISTAILIFTVITFSQYLIYSDINIDTVFVTKEIASKYNSTITYPYKMSPIAAIAIMQLCLVNLCRMHRSDGTFVKKYMPMAFSLTSIILAITLTVADFFNITFIVGWGNIHSTTLAASFCILAIAVINLSVPNCVKCLLTFISSVVFCFFIISWLHFLNEEYKETINKVEAEMKIVNTSVETQFYLGYQTLNRLSQRVNNDSYKDNVSLKKDMGNYIQDFNSLEFLLIYYNGSPVLAAKNDISLKQAKDIISSCNTSKDYSCIKLLDGDFYAVINNNDMINFILNRYYPDNSTIHVFIDGNLTLRKTSETNRNINNNFEIFAPKLSLANHSWQIAIFLTEEEYKEQKLHFSSSYFILGCVVSFFMLFILFFIDKFRDKNIELAEKTQRLRTLSNTDDLTECFNRSYLLNELPALLEQITDGYVSVLFIDLDNFKDVNDSLGHKCGDEVLKTTAKRLKRNLRGQDIIARIGGDEFIIVLNGVKDKDAISNILHRTLEVFKNPINTPNKIRVQQSISIGVAMADATTNISADSLINNADSAMYKAKEMGKNTYSFYEDCK